MELAAEQLEHRAEYLKLVYTLNGKWLFAQDEVDFKYNTALAAELRRRVKQMDSIDEETVT